jgi:hypothetical protein
MPTPWPQPWPLITSVLADALSARADVVAVVMTGGAVVSAPVVTGSARRLVEAIPAHPSSPTDVVSSARRSTEPR